MIEICGICGCRLHRGGGYATSSIRGRSHATRHHYVAERFFGRSANRRGEQRKRVFFTCPWGLEGRADVYCYDCHELLLHNPVLLPGDVARLNKLVVRRGLDEPRKSRGYMQLAGRIKLLHEVIDAGLTAVMRRTKRPATRMARSPHE